VPVLLSAAKDMWALSQYEYALLASTGPPTKWQSKGELDYVFDVLVLVFDVPVRAEYKAIYVRQ
jgi:hypothetical protein